MLISIAVDQSLALLLPASMAQAGGWGSHAEGGCEERSPGCREGRPSAKERAVVTGRENYELKRWREKSQWKEKKRTDEESKVLGIEFTYLKFARGASKPSRRVLNFSRPRDTWSVRLTWEAPRPFRKGA